MDVAQQGREGTRLCAVCAYQEHFFIICFIHGLFMLIDRINQLLQAMALTGYATLRPDIPAI